mmetsp:Transcript_50578/g.100644  ORF Transcript_50578/g.100644 Transcript_50578/m.100644 type:complete len:217 (+) Transcript_50578:728-1378(+)
MSTGGDLPRCQMLEPQDEDRCERGREGNSEESAQEGGELILGQAEHCSQAEGAEDRCVGKVPQRHHPAPTYEDRRRVGEEEELDRRALHFLVELQLAPHEYKPRNGSSREGHCHTSIFKCEPVGWPSKLREEDIRPRPGSHESEYLFIQQDDLCTRRQHPTAAPRSLVPSQVTFVMLCGECTTRFHGSSSAVRLRASFAARASLAAQLSPLLPPHH